MGRRERSFSRGDPYRGDMAFHTQHGHIPERAWELQEFWARNCPEELYPDRLHKAIRIAFNWKGDGWGRRADKAFATLGADPRLEGVRAAVAAWGIDAEERENGVYPLGTLQWFVGSVRDEGLVSLIHSCMFLASPRGRRELIAAVMKAAGMTMHKADAISVSSLPETPEYVEGSAQGPSD